DFDRVAEHNLQRQLLHDEASIGESKTASAAQRLRATNPHIEIVPHADGITAENAVRIFSDYDVILDGTDNFSSRYLNNDAAFFAKKPLVYGSVFKFEGQVAVFAPSQGGPCYRCLFPNPPPPGSVPGCGEAGVLGALCGVIGSMQALETLKLVTGIGKPLVGRLLTYNALTQDFATLTLPRNHSCPLCGGRPSIRALQQDDDAAATCTPPQTSASAPAAAEVPLKISVHHAKRLLDAGQQAAFLIDVREPYELEICAIQPAEQIPMRQIPERLDSLPKDKHLLILCHSGARSLRVTEFLRARGFKSVSNVEGGIDAWAEEIDPSLRRY
ncbi:MAG: ThiF family adenylyltransferase, partial [Opitutaceae bacterium]